MGSVVFKPDMWVPLHDHLNAVQAERDKTAAERDRRYTEVKNAEEKALKIKEEADKVALDLARQIQTYKDQQHNGLLDQLGQERGRYATKDDLKSLTEKMEIAVKPLTEFVAGAQGGSKVYTQIALIVGVVATLITVIAKFL
jgi:hypothetical protein